MWTKSHTHTSKGILSLETKQQPVLFLGTSLSSRHLLLLGDPYAITVLKTEFKCLNKKKTVCPRCKAVYKLCRN